ncbi:MAG: nucleotide exchange factor GrpE [Alphaproteobacteria bacterium]|nr:nucleotide exchange factor GrpE [Alphaproteobacteria bacterium]
MSEQHTQPQNQNRDSSANNNEEETSINDAFELERQQHGTHDSTETYDSFSDELDNKATEKENHPADNTPNNSDPSTQQKDGGQQHIQALEEQLDRMKDHMVRALADAENTRKRAAKERQDASKFAISNFARDVLSVADNLRRALEAVPKELAEESPQIKTLTDGIEATERELIRCFEKNGITKLEPLGEDFDPNFHEVMFETPVPNQKSGSIIQIIEPGYTINGRILRPARVGIAKNITPQEPNDKGPIHTVDTEA